MTERERERVGCRCETMIKLGQPGCHCLHDSLDKAYDIVVRRPD